LGLLFFGLPCALQLAHRQLAVRSNSNAGKGHRNKPQNSRSPCRLALSLKLPTGQFLNAQPSKFSEVKENPRNIYLFINFFTYPILPLSLSPPLHFILMLTQTVMLE